MKSRSRGTRRTRGARRGRWGPSPGGGSGSSLTIRADAEPTWWTCSSALGRSRMKRARGRADRLGGHGVREPPSTRLAAQIVGGRVSAEQLAVEERGGRAVHAEVSWPTSSRLSPESLPAPLSIPACTGGVVRARLPGQLDQVLVARGGSRSSLGWFSNSRSRYFFPTSGPYCWSTTPIMVAPAGVRAEGAEQDERPVLDLDLARVGEGGQFGAVRPSRTRHRWGTGSPRRRSSGSAESAADGHAGGGCRRPARLATSLVVSRSELMMSREPMTTAIATTTPIHRQVSFGAARRRCCSTQRRCRTFLAESLLLSVGRGFAGHGQSDSGIVVGNERRVGALRERSRLSRASRVRPLPHEVPPTARAGTTSRAISHGYFEAWHPGRSRPRRSSRSRWRCRAPRRR